MTEEWARVIIAAMLFGSVASVIICIAAFVNADTLVRAYKRLRGQLRKCPRCDGSGRWNGVVCGPCDGTGEVI